MKKVSGVFKAKGFGEYPFEFYVDDGATSEQIRNEVYKQTGVWLNWVVEDGYEAYTITKYRKRRSAL